MTDLRKYTGTQRLQAGWSILAVGLLALILATRPTDELLLEIGVISGVWLVGLLSFAYMDRRQWNQMVAGSGFDHEQSTRPVDLERLYRNRSVYVQTVLPHILAQTHTEISTRVEGVDARFTVRLTHVADAGADEGIQTGNDAIDGQFVIDGSEQNVAHILSPDVIDALAGIDTAGTMTITHDEITYIVPFTRLSSTELDTLADAVVAVAEQVEQVGRQS